ncbi:Rieske 2Fe-2S domain-containing protein [Nocardia sp. NPDC003693]
MATTPPRQPHRVREIDVGAAPDRFARGWHCLGLSASFRDGEPHSVQAFGTKLVVWADSAGELRVLDAYCRHMGADLSKGTIKGDNIACPFHDWRWNGSGKCADIPYARRVPPLARTRTWTTLERNGQLFVWHDHEGNQPAPEVTIPVIEGPYAQDGSFNAEWTPWTWNSLLIEGAHCREIVDNIVDMAHFFYIHYAFPVSFKNVFEGHVATQLLKTKPRTDIGSAADYGDSLLISEASYFGPSYMINPLKNMLGGFEIESVLINCHYPVSNDSFVLQWGMSLHKPQGLPDDAAEMLVATMEESISAGFLQDVEIWKHKSKIDNPLLCEDDGPVYHLRRWYEQFYVDVADIDPKAVQRLEFEVDTSKANQAWEVEVQDNLARRAAAVESETDAASAPDVESATAGH